MFKQPSKISGLGLTYDDVLLVPSYSQVLPRNVNINLNFQKYTPECSNRFPAMDTVTESKWPLPWLERG
ncbi:MAG: hypothetical protein CM15mP32_6290 [Flavobacteriaceae bacterium]|nr:MAG: hypothetical protein CM15mP32_6290 [Flavobacteriaceae bacterium]